MAEDEAVKKPENTPSGIDLEFRKYEARLGVWKVVLGTMIVGLAGIVFPFIISFYTTYFETLRKNAEATQAQQIAHQQYIKDFFDTAVNQDIELRIRFADYFANVSGPDQQTLWRQYLASQELKRSKLRETINSLEHSIALTDPNKEHTFTKPEEAAKFNELRRNLDWAYKEIGYVPLQSVATSGGADRKQQLYAEAIDTVSRLVERSTAFDPADKDWVRFWTLYGKELIGIETPEFAAAMVAFGSALKKLNTEKLPPDDALKLLGKNIEAVATREFSYFGNSAVK